jgi:CheY-like chemotaxis protein
MPKVVLIVEKNFNMLVLMCTLVRGYGYRVIEAENGQEAFEKARQQRPDLLLIDISNEPIKALSAVKNIKNLACCNTEIPVIALTRYTNTYFHQALQAGCNELLEKPLDFNILKFLLTQYLS